MKKINEFLSKKLAYEEKLCLFRLAQNKELNEDEVFGSLQIVEDLTEVNLNSKDFDVKSISALGIDDCCNLFKALCEQYRDLVTIEEDADFIAHQKRMNIAIGTQKQGVKPRIMNIGLSDSAKMVDSVISENFTELMNGAMQGNKDTVVYRYAVFNTFGNMYYSIRDFIEGKSYYDGRFMTEYRDLSSEYEEQSQNILNAFIERAKVNSIDVAKEQLLNTLNEGIESLKDLPLEKQMEDTYTSNISRK